MGYLNVIPAQVQTTHGIKAFPTVGVPNNLPMSLTYSDPTSVINSVFGGSLSYSDMACPHDTWANLSMGQDVPYLTLSNGNYLFIGKRTTSNYFYIGRCVNGVKIESTSTASWEDCRYDFTQIFSDSGSDIKITVIAFNSNHTKIWGYTSGLMTYEEWDEFVNGAEPITWKSWGALRGNNGQYRTSLTQIKDSSIGEFSQAVTGTSDDFNSINADIWGDFQNMIFGEERTLAWSGNAYMTFKITAESQMPDYANFIFKFYSNQGSLLLTHTKLVRWRGTGASIACYLSFAYGENKMVALFAPVLKSSDGTTYTWGYNNYYDDTEMLNLWQWLQMSNAGDYDGPYDTGTSDNGGNPSGDVLTNDDMPNVNVPTLSALQTGMLTVYVPDETELQHIASYLWSDNVIDNFKKYFNNFSDNLISLYVLPYKPSSLPNKPFKVGGLESTDLELASVDYITNRFVNIDMGEVKVGGLWNSYLDFSPYTKFNIYLPGIGVQAIDADDIMAPLDRDKNFGAELGSTLKLDYVLDLMTGILVAYIKVNGQVRYQFSGKIGYQIPLTGENYNNIVHAFTVAASGFVTTLASGGQTAPFALGAVAAAAINFNKPDVYRGGNLSGSASSMSFKHPYLIRRVPNKPLLVNQDKFTGFPTYKSGKLKDFGGYTEVVEVHAEGFVCTEEEREEIIELLKKGVIL